jgi:hypothetical protein
MDDERPNTNADIVAGYRRRAERDARIAAELEGSSREANEVLGDAPEW